MEYLTIIVISILLIALVYILLKRIKDLEAETADNLSDRNLFADRLCTLREFITNTHMDPESEEFDYDATNHLVSIIITFTEDLLDDDEYMEKVLNNKEN